MIKIIGNDIWRGNDKIGWVRGNDILDEDGRKIGYFTGNDIYDVSGKKIAYIEHNRVFPKDGEPFPLDDVRRHIYGGTISDIARVAIKLLIGD